MHVAAGICMMGKMNFAFPGYLRTFPVKWRRGLITIYFKVCGRRGAGYMVSALVSESSGPGWGHSVVFLGKTTQQL